MSLYERHPWRHKCYKCGINGADIYTRDNTGLILVCNECYKRGDENGLLRT